MKFVCFVLGIAATNLHDGRTAHATLKIPLNLVTAGIEDLAVPIDSDLAEMLRQAR